MRKINKIIIHCTATPEGQMVTAKDIDRWHKERGFSKIGYHYVILLDGRIEKGRDLTEVGAHCAGENTNSIGIVYVGGLDKNNKPKDTRTLAQKKALRELVKELTKQFPYAQVHGHNEYSNKACPCFNVKNEI